MAYVQNPADVVSAYPNYEVDKGMLVCLCQCLCHDIHFFPFVEVLCAIGFVAAAYMTCLQSDAPHS
jgi:hypothetical protein